MFFFFIKIPFKQLWVGRQSISVIQKKNTNIFGQDSLRHVFRCCFFKYLSPSCRGSLVLSVVVVVIVVVIVVLLMMVVFMVRTPPHALLNRGQAICRFDDGYEKGPISH